jgi:hypothetical protein
MTTTEPEPFRTFTTALVPAAEGSAGRDFAAWLGMTPLQKSTGGKQNSVSFQCRPTKHRRTEPNRPRQRGLG